jgi:hypothetical protein
MLVVHFLSFNGIHDLSTSFATIPTSWLYWVIIKSETHTHVWCTPNMSEIVHMVPLPHPASWPPMVKNVACSTVVWSKRRDASSYWIAVAYFWIGFLEGYAQHSGGSWWDPLYVAPKSWWRGLSRWILAWWPPQAPVIQSSNLFRKASKLRKPNCDTPKRLSAVNRLRVLQ